MRVTRHALEIRVANINGRLGRTPDKHSFLTLNYNSHYGGYNLCSNKGSTTVQHRIPAKEMLNYLEGLLTGIDMKEGAYRHEN